LLPITKRLFHPKAAATARQKTRRLHHESCVLHLVSVTSTAFADKRLTDGLDEEKSVVS
jgi:hypothetical protein